MQKAQNMEAPYSLDFSKMNITDMKKDDGFVFNNNDPSHPDRPIATQEKPNWWKTCTAYQIWPASFKDGNDDGLGDIPGILSKLDYLQELGADMIWLSREYSAFVPPRGRTDGIFSYHGFFARNSRFYLTRLC